MRLIEQLPTFVAAVLLIAAVPGPAVALLIRRAAVGGFRAGAPVVFGLEAGIYAWIVAAGAGLATLVTASTAAYATLRIAGAVVLVILGVQAWRSALRGEHRDDGQLSVARLTGGRRGGVTMGFVTNVANPKAAVFAFAFYPQFIPEGYPILATAAVLGVLQVAMETAVYLALVALVGRAREWFVRTRVRRSLDAVCGTVLVALGLRVAAQSR